MVVVFGGIDAQKRPLDDLVVLDVKARVWFRPLADGDVLGPEGSAARSLLPPAPGDVPGARAFHTACCVSLGNFIVVFGGRGTDKRYNDVWVLDTLKWMWTRVLSGEEPEETPEEEEERRERWAEPGPLYEDLVEGTTRSPGEWLKASTAPSPREFHGMCQVSPEAMLVYGGWTGTGWVGDAHLLRVFPAPFVREEVFPQAERPPILFWFGQVQLQHAPGRSAPAQPTPRSGQAMVGMDGRVVVLGGGGGEGQYLNDAWVLKMRSGHTPVMEHKEGDVAMGEWRQLGMGSTPPHPRSGHAMHIVGDGNLLVHGGHGTEGWLNKSNVYFGDIHVLPRSSGRWTALRPRTSPGAGGPRARAYHTLTPVTGISRGSRQGALLLLGGWDGKVTFGDMWLLEYDTRAFAAISPPPMSAAAALFARATPTPPARTPAQPGRSPLAPATPTSASAATPPSAWVSTLGRQLTSYLSPATGGGPAAASPGPARAAATPVQTQAAGRTTPRWPATTSADSAPVAPPTLASGLQDSASRMLASLSDATAESGVRGSFFEGHLRETIQLLAELDAPGMSLAEVGALLQVCHALCEARLRFPTPVPDAAPADALSFRGLSPDSVTLEQVPRILAATLELATALHVDLVMA